VGVSLFDKPNCEMTFDALAGPMQVLTMTERIP
jgi:hypothetical protein